MNREIRVLDKFTAGQIAAGEVIDRPSSVLKELIENSLDAGATQVTVECEVGGTQLMSVKDNGSGMSLENLNKCLAQHATSKISELTDLNQLYSYGFRGEALYSIQLCSEIEIISKSKNSDSAYSISSTFGKNQTTAEPIAATQGTQIKVKNLFSQIPARQKFLRAPSTEIQYCHKVVREAALAYPTVQFHFFHNNKLVMRTRATDRKSRYLELLKPQWQPITIKEKNDDISIEGFLTPGHMTQDRGDVITIVNHRPITEKKITSAVRKAYLDSLGPHHVPSGILYLDIDPELIDFNVHPQKREVRFWKGEKLFPYILTTVKKELARQNTHKPAFPQTKAQSHDIKFVTNSNPTPVPLPQDTHTQVTNAQKRKFPKFDSIPFPLYEKETTPPAPQPTFTQQPLIENPENERGAVAESHHVLCQAKASYVLAESEKGLVILDQHALHEKFLYEQLCKQFSDKPLLAQQLLFPESINLNPEQVEFVRTHQKKLSYLGWEVELNEQKVLLTSYPEILSTKSQTKNIGQIFEALLLEWKEFPPYDNTLPEAHRHILATMACHSAVRAGEHLSDSEWKNIYQTLKKIESGWTCPHGRPITFEIPWREIEKHFNRC